MKKKPFLVLTADETTWPSNSKKVFFLGKWCLLNERKKKWSKYRYKLIQSQKKTKFTLLKEFNYSEKLYEKILKELTLKLNKIHNTKYSLRAWRIIIGPWLNRFIAIVYNRHEILKNFSKNHNFNNFRIINGIQKKTSTFNTSEFTDLASQDNWNHFLFLKIMILITEKNKFNHKFRFLKKQKISIKYRNSLIKKINYNNLLTKFLRNKYVFFNTYFNKRIDVIKLITGLGDIPYKLNFDLTIKKENFSENIRKKIYFKKSNNKGIENIIKVLLPDYIPEIFLESFDNLRKTVDNSNLPKERKTIFAANGLYKDEVFKMWTANQIEKKGKLLCGQHGGTYGISFFSYAENHEKKICDKFLTWGWSEKNKRTLPASAFKILNSKKSKRVDFDKILLVLNRNGRYLIVNQSERIDSETANEYTNFIFDFLNKLPKKILKKTFIKLYPNDNEYSNSIGDILKNKYKDLNFIESGDLKGIINNFKLIILTNNNTSFLETIGVNKPCILLVNKKISFLRSSAFKYYKRLSKVKIFHNSIDSCIGHIKKNLDELYEWWDSTAVENVKQEFCNKYANTEDSSLKKTIKIFKNNHVN